MQGLPYKTPGMMKNRAYHVGVQRQRNKRGEERYGLTVMYADLQAAAQFAKTDERRKLLWEEINTLAQQAKKGKDTNVTALWFFPVDMVSFAQSLCVTDVITEGLSGRAKRAT